MPEKQVSFLRSDPIVSLAIPAPENAPLPAPSYRPFAGTTKNIHKNRGSTVSQALAIEYAAVRGLGSLSLIPSKKSLVTNLQRTKLTFMFSGQGD